MGNRELQFRTNQYIFSSPYPVWRQLPAVWMAGFAVAVITGIGWPIRMLFTGEFNMILVWLVGAAYIPSLALALGVWSGSSKMFEVIYFVLWYVGPMNHTPSLDYIGVTMNGPDPGTTLLFFVIMLILIFITVIGRKRQVYI